MEVVTLALTRLARAGVRLGLVAGSGQEAMKRFCEVPHGGCLALLEVGLQCKNAVK